jgi:acyl carrier protein
MSCKRNVELLDSVDPKVFPQTEVEQFLVAVWSELLRQPKVGPQDDFFELGGYSLLAMDLISKIYQQFQVELPVQKIYEFPTISSLAKEIKKVIQSMPQTGQPTKNRQPRKDAVVTGIVPLTPAQAWILKIQNYQPDHFNLSRMFELDNNFEPDKLKKVLIYLWNIHDSLRARFIRRGEKWEQIIDGPEQSDPDFREYNLAETLIEDEERIIEEYAELLQRSINITQGPLMLTAYLNFGSKRPGRLILIVHHFLADGISMATLVKDLQTAYRQLCEGQAINLSKKGISIKEWAEMLHTYVLSDEHRKTIDYLLTLPWGEVPGLPLDFPQNHDQNFNNSTAKITESLTKEETIILNRKTPLVFNTKVDNVLLWALTKVISGWTGNKLVEFTMVGNGREMIPGQKYLDLSSTLGDLATRRTLLLENIKCFDWRQEIALFCKQIKSIVNNGYDYFLAASLNDDNHVIEKLQKIRNIEKYLSYSEIFLNYRGLIHDENIEGSKLKLTHQSCGSNLNPQNNRLRNLNISCDITNHCLNIVWEYSYNLYKRKTVERLAGKFIQILKDLIAKLAS